jgi:2-keto-4-pentenoate hydratase/2-oxohepta-3-ene-1,7-dioic acid hydratase in catechol pathway
MATEYLGKYSRNTQGVLRLATYREPVFGAKRTAILFEEHVLDLNTASQVYLVEQERDLPYVSYSESFAPTSMQRLIEAGEPALTHIEKVFKYFSNGLNPEARGPEKQRYVFGRGEVKIEAPLRPGKIVHTAGNFREHAQEADKAGWPFPIPQWISFLKNPDAVIGHDDHILKPSFTNQLDHELELGIIIGKKIKNVSPEKAFEAIFGFTVFNDVTARDIQREEMKNGLLNYGKNLDTFAPLGPCIVPRKYIGDVHNLTMELRVNGDVRQSGSTAKLSVRVEQIVSKYSWATLNPGDMVSTGTISGVAAFRKPDPTPFFLKKGDVLECEIANIGLIRNTVMNAE